MSHDGTAAVPNAVPDCTGSAWNNVRRNIDPEHAARVRQCFKDNHAQLVRWLTLRLGTRAGAGEIADQAFARMLEATRPERIENLKAYVYRIATNLAAEKAETAAVHRRLQQVLICERYVSDPSPESLCLEQQQQEFLQKVVQSLPPRVRWALQLRFWEGLQYVDITQRFRARGVVVNLRTVQRWVAYGLERCRHEMERLEGEVTEKGVADVMSKQRQRDATRYFVEDDSADELL
jgi:RNA polymerase sigma-70 factor (ECF subfamily)